MFRRYIPDPTLPLKFPREKGLDLRFLFRGREARILRGPNDGLHERYFSLRPVLGRVNNQT